MTRRIGRTGKAPGLDDSFLTRICHALDEPPRMVAAKAGIEYADFEPLLGKRSELIEQDRDEAWWKISEYVNGRIGNLLAIRQELDRALQKDRAKRAVHIAQQRLRDKKPSPRS